MVGPPEREGEADASPSLKRSLEYDTLPHNPAKRAKLDVEATDDPPTLDLTSSQSIDQVSPDSGDKEKSTSHHGDKSKPRRGKQKDRVRDRRRGTKGDAEEPTDLQEPKAPRLPKRQSALLIGFCGSGYSGMQIQPDPKLRTIEGVLFKALVTVGAVSQDNADDPIKVNLGRAARTDAGVHAAGNVVSMKLITEIPGVTDLVSRVNDELPPEIRLWSVLRVQNAFNARTTCDSRKYTYFFPSYLIISPKPSSGLYRTLQQNGSEHPPHPFWTTTQPDDDVAHELRRKREHRIPHDVLEALRATVRRFEGAHNFHNFTVGREFRDRSCSRFMKSIEIADPVVYRDTEWVSVLFHGQSFMLHQRKMMSALVLACRTGSPPQIIDELYGPRKVFIPKMPALGLLLEYPIFETYCRKVVHVNQKVQPSHAEYRPPIDFEIYREQIDGFKEEHIYSQMREIEDTTGVFDEWMRYIDAYSGNDLLYLNNKGVIPPAAVIKLGERRSNPFKEKKRFDATSYPTVADDDATLVADDQAEEAEESEVDKAKLEDMEG